MKQENRKNKGRISPHNIEAEEAVLGCMLLSKNAVSKSLQSLTKESFYTTANSIIFSNMIELYDKDETIDNVTVCEQLTKNKQLKNVGGSYYITGLSNNAPTAENVDFYAKIVKEKYILRTIINTASRISTDAYDNQKDVIDILDSAEQELFTLSQNAEKGKFVEIEPLLHDVLDNWGNRKSGSLTGILILLF